MKSMSRFVDIHIPMYLSHIVTIPLFTATATKDVHLDMAVATICDDVGHTRSALCSISANKTP